MGRGRKAGIHATIRQLEQGDELIASAAGAVAYLRRVHTVEVSKYMLRNTPEATLPVERRSDGICVWRTAVLDDAASGFRTTRTWAVEFPAGAVSVAEAARELGVQIDAVYNAVRRGRLERVQVGRLIGVSRASVETYKANRLPTRGPAMTQLAGLTRRQAARRMSIAPERVGVLLDQGYLRIVAERRSTQRVVREIDSASVDELEANRMRCSCGHADCDELVWPGWPYAPGYYVALVSNADALRGSVGFYRALDATLAQNDQRATVPLPMPVLTIGGETGYGAHVEEAMTPLADELQSLVIPGVGHWVAEKAPDEMLAALTTFLAPIREAPALTR